MQSDVFFSWGFPMELLRLAEVTKKVGLSRATVYRDIGQGTFPPPIKVGGASRWVGAEVDEWISAQIERSRADRR